MRPALGIGSGSEKGYVRKVFLYSRTVARSARRRGREKPQGERGEQDDRGAKRGMASTRATHRWMRPAGRSVGSGSWESPSALSFRGASSRRATRNPPGLRTPPRPTRTVLVGVTRHERADATPLGDGASNADVSQTEGYRAAGIGYHSGAIRTNDGEPMRSAHGAERLPDRWDEQKAAGMSEPERLLYRSNLLGSDLRITNFGGGNTSAKVTQKDPLTGQDATVLWVKGSGGDLGSMKTRRLRDAVPGQAGVAAGPLPRPRPRGRDGGVPAALHLRPQPPRRVDRHAAARVHPEGACRPHAPRRGDRDRRLERLRAAHAGDLRRRDRLAAVAAARIRPGPEARGDGEEPAGPQGRRARRPRPLHLGRRPRGSATSRRCGSSRRPRTTWRRSAEGRAVRDAVAKPRRRGGARRRCWPSSCPALRGQLSKGVPQGHALHGRARGAGVRGRGPGRGAGRARHLLPRPFPAHQDPAAGPRLRPGDRRTRERRRGPPRRRARGLPRATTRPTTSAAGGPTSPGAARPEPGHRAGPGRRHDHLRQGQGHRAHRGEFYVNAINVMREAESVSTYVADPGAGGLRHRVLAARGGEAAAHAEAEEPGRAASRWSPAAPAASAARPRSASWRRAPASCITDIDRARSTRRVAALAAAVREGPRPGLRCDVTDEASVRAAVRLRRCGSFGGIDILRLQRRHRLGGADRGDHAGRCGTATSTSSPPATSWWRARRFALHEGAGDRRLDRVHRQQERARGLARALRPTAPPRRPSSTSRAASRSRGAGSASAPTWSTPTRCIRGSRIWSGDVARGARRREQDHRRRDRGLLPRAQPAEAQRLPGGHRRGGLLLRLGAARRSPPATSSTSTPATWRVHALSRQEGSGACAHGDPASSWTSTTARPCDWLHAGLRAPRQAARAARRRHRAADRAGRGLPGGRALVGRRHRRHALRALPRARRAAQRLREARGLRRHQPAGAGDARRLAAHPVGRAGEPGRAQGVRGGARPLLRRHELEHLPGPAGPEAVLQVRQPHPRRRRGARAGGRAQRRLHRARDRRSGRARTPCGSATGATSPARSTSGARSSATSRACARSTRRCPTACGMFIEHKLYEPAFYSTVLNDWGTSYYCTRGAGPQGVLPRGPRPPRPEREHRDDRGAAHPAREAGRLPLQRQQVRGRRPRRRLDQALPALPRLQRAGGRGAREGAGLRPRLHARPVAQRDGPDRVADDERRRAGAGVRAGAPRGPGGAARGAGEKRRDPGAAGAQAGLHRGRGADPGHGAAPRGRRDRPRRRVPGERLPAAQGGGAAGGRAAEAPASSDAAVGSGLEL